MPDQEGTIAVHPVCIFKQAWSICWKNLGPLSAIYLIFNLPLTVISFSPLVRSLPDQKFSLVALLWLLFVIVVGSWGYIALLLRAEKASNAQDYTIGQSISQAKAFLVKYLALVLSITVFIVGVVIVAGGAAAAVVAFLPQINKMLAQLVLLILIIAVIAFLIFVALRWSLGGLVCVLEGSGPISALKRSSALVKKHINPVVGTYGLLTLAYFVGLAPMTISIISQVSSGLGPEAALSAQRGMTIYSAILNIVLAPFVTMIIVVLYKKLKEAFEAHVHA